MPKQTSKKKHKTLKNSAAQPRQVVSEVAAHPIEQATVPAPEAARPPKRRMPWHRIALEVTTIAGVLVLLWTAGNMFFGKIVLGNHVVAGNTAVPLLEEMVVSEAAAYRLHITAPGSAGKSASFSLQDMGVRVNPVDTVVAVRRAQRTPRQLLEWWRPVRLDVQTEIDATTFTAFITKNASVVTQPAQNAALSIANGTVSIQSATLGRQLGLDNASLQIIQAVQNLQTTPLLLHPLALQPTVTAPALAAAKAQLNSVLHEHISVTVGDQTVTPDANDIAQWLRLSPTAAGATTIAIDKSAVQHYLASLASNHNTPPRSQVLASSDGRVLLAGQRGVQVGDVDAAAGTLASNVLSGGKTTVSLPVSYTAYQTVRAPTADKWIEVNLTTKRMYAYDQGTLVQSFLVSAGAPGTPTVTGTFSIYSKYRSQDMYGENVDGSSYFQPAVPYVNYFYKDYAIHGNYWRPASYFGNVNSSHGCVGVQVDSGAWIYGWAPAGTPVVVHT